MKSLSTLMGLLLFSQLSFAQSVVVDVVLNPMGDFKAKTSDVKGFAVKNGNKVSAQNIVVNLKNLKTEVEARDKHTQKYLQTDKYPEAVLISAEGENGKGKGRIKIKGIEKDITGVYKIEGSALHAKFKLKLTDFKIEGINYMGVGVEDDVVLNVKVPIQAGK